MNRLCSFIFVLFATTFVSFAQNETDSAIVKINAIKMSPEYLYGESTDMDESVARNDAISELVAAFDEYFKGKKDVRIDTDKIRTVQHMRGRNTRVFAYIPLDSLTTTKSAENLVNVTDIEKMICSSSSWDEVCSYFQSEPYSSSVSVGVIDLSTDEKTINRSYLLITRGNKKSIEKIYGPMDADHHRKDFKSGVVSSLIDYKVGDIVYWLYVNDN